MVRRIALPAMVVVGLAGIGAGVVLQRQDRAIAAAQAEVSATLTQMALTAADIASAQQGYIAVGQPSEQWSARTGELLQRLVRGSAEVRPQLRSAEAAGLLQTFSGAVDSLAMIDERIRANLAIDQKLSASDLIFTEGRDTVELLIATSLALGSSERARSDAERATLLERGWWVVATVALTWTVGLVALLRRQPGDARPARARARSGQDETLPPAHQTAKADPQAADIPQPPSLPEGDVELDAAAAVCVDLSRVTDVDELPDLFARMAVVLDASGIILWLARGEELLALRAHGYDPKVLSRLGPIARHANNATAAAWRSGELTVVPGDKVANGAVVAPVWSADRCIGVLAAEVRHGRESNRAAAAVTTMFAAQLATLVVALPVRTEGGGGPGAGPPMAASL